MVSTELHLSVFSAETISSDKTSIDISDFVCSYNRVKLLLTCNTIKGTDSSDKIKR